MTVREYWGMACPQCGDDEKMQVTAQVVVLLVVEGVDDVGNDREWEDNSSCSCTACGFDGVVKDFVVPTSDRDLTAEQLDDKYNTDGTGEHPQYTRSYWRESVAQEHTTAGYWDWVVDQLSSEEN